MSVHLVKSDPVFIIYMQKCIRHVSLTQQALLEEGHNQSTAIILWLLLGLHTNVYFEFFFDAMYVWAFRKTSLLYSFNFAHCFIIKLI